MKSLCIKEKQTTSKQNYKIRKKYPIFKSKRAIKKIPHFSIILNDEYFLMADDSLSLSPFLSTVFRKGKLKLLWSIERISANVVTAMPVLGTNLPALVGQVLNQIVVIEVKLEFINHKPASHPINNFVVSFIENGIF